MHKSSHRLLLVTILLASFAGLSFVDQRSKAFAQEQQTADDPTKVGSSPAIPLPPNNPEFDHVAELEQFKQAVDKWRETLAQMGEVLVYYHNGDESVAKRYRDEFRQLEMQGREEFDAVYASALKIIENAPRESLEAAQFLVAAVPYRFSKDWYEGTGEGAEALLRIEYNEPKLSEIAGVSFYATQQYDKASKHLQDAQAKGTLDPMFAALPQTVEQLRQLWGSEAELRARDAAKDDLPRVKLVTTRGDVIIELFEDEAPNTVANFIDLVENGQYDGAPYYQVLDRQIAMAGDATGDRAGGMGFMIADEILGGKNRTMFRGSLAMAKLPDAQSQTRLTYPDTASSHFFLAYQPIIPASSEHMIFGRVIEGLEHCCSFNRIDPTAKKEEGEPEVLPDRILSAEVLRKRNHEYKPLRKSLEEMNATPPK